MHGLSNLGNTCCINALVQCIRHSPSLIHALTTCEDGSERGLSVEIVDVARKLENSSVSAHGLVSTIYNILGNYVTQGEQQDIVELWMLVVDRLENELAVPLDPIKVTQIQTYSQRSIQERVQASRHSFNKYKTCDLLDAVQGTQLSTIVCECGFVQGNIEVFTSMNVDIQTSGPSTSITESLEKYLSIEPVEHWKCDKCHEMGKAQKQIKIWDAPKVMVVTLKRFEMAPSGTSYIKLNTPINVNEAFSIDTAQNTRVTYRLVSIGNHHGGHEGGHYTAICMHGDKWVLYDDADVHDLGFALTYSGRDAYLLMYEMC